MITNIPHEKRHLWGHTGTACGRYTQSNSQGAARAMRSARHRYFGHLLGHIGNESVSKIIINDTTIFLTSVSILVISNHNSFRVLFDKIASVYFVGKYINIWSLQMTSPGNQHCANYIGALLFPIVHRGVRTQGQMGSVDPRGKWLKN